MSAIRFLGVTLTLIVPMLFASSVCANPNFRIFSSTTYLGQPDMTEYNIKPLEITNNIWPEPTTTTPQDEPDEASIRRYARSVVSRGMDMAVLDIENWPMSREGLYVEDNPGVEDTLAKFIKVADWMHSEAPGVKIGFYMYPVVRDFWTPVVGYNDVARVARWHDRNDALQPLADKVDMIIPSLYTFYDMATSADAWKRYAIANIQEAKQYGKPVYVILWPEYHDSNTTLKGTNIPGVYWREQLETVYEYADGVIIWGGWKRSWDPNAEWWLSTVEFIRDHGLNSLPAPTLKLQD